MTAFQLTATWSFESTFHIGTGLSGSGVDRTVHQREFFRSTKALDLEEAAEDDDAEELMRVRNPEIGGDAVKGSVRGSAERIVRWLIHPRELREEDDNSIPRHPALRRIFAWQIDDAGGPDAPVSYRFSAPRYLEGGQLGAIASTAMNPDRGIALENTLRVIQHWSANAWFAVTIDGRGGDWENPLSRDYLDLVLLVAAFAATAQIGGKKGNGLGETAVQDWSLTPHPKPVLDAETLASLRASLLAELPEKDQHA